MLYGIRHVATKTATKTAMIKRAVFPPRLSDWTLVVEEAHPFEHKREAEAAAKFITEQAFNVEVFVLEK